MGDGVAAGAYMAGLSAIVRSGGPELGGAVILSLYGANFHFVENV
jgi:hypothetical protein